MINPREERARARKVAAILSVLVQSAEKAGVNLTVESLDGLDWNRAALIAGVRPPSATTIEVIRERVRACQLGRGVPACKHCGRALMHGELDCSECSVSDAELMHTLKQVRQEFEP